MTLLPIPTDREAWHALRQRHVGASEVAALFGCEPPYALGVRALWEVKAGRAPRPEVNNPRTRAGLALEEAIASLAADQEGWTVQPGVYASRDGLGATLDRLIAAPGPNDDGATGPGVLELKNVDWMVHRSQWGGEPPTHILLQLQAQLAATGFTWGAVAALVGGNDLHVYRYTARPRLQADMLDRVATFWRSIAAGEPPRPDGSDATYRALIAVHPVEDEEPADLTGDNEAPQLAADFLRLSAEIKARDKQRNEIRNRLLEKLGVHRRGEAQGFRITQAVTPEREARPANPSEIIPGRAESRRLIVKEVA